MHILRNTILNTEKQHPGYMVSIIEALEDPSIETPATNMEFKFDLSPIARYQAARNNKQMPISFKKIGRNELCPCGSGKKYKHCCGK